LLALFPTQSSAARVSSETKDRLKSLAAKRQLSESALRKDLLELTLGGPAVPAPDGAESVVRVARRARLYVRLRPDDQLLLAERAAARRMAAATYVSVLVRAHLRHLAPLPHDELRALNRAVADLGTIGRNLNQIARATHQAALATGPHRGDVLAMLKVCEALRDHVKALLEENAVSWKVGYAEPNH
jgi:hypothetical protein